MRETQGSICAWGDATFGTTASLARVAARANEEMAEVLRALTADKPPADVAVEVADTVIVLCRAADLAGMQFRRVDEAGETDAHAKWLCGHIACHAATALVRAIEFGDHPSEFEARDAIRSAYLHLGDLCRSVGFGLWATIDKKMAINRAREWRRDGGHGYHVREKVTA
jgi:hypothetical protein